MPTVLPPVEFGERSYVLKRDFGFHVWLLKIGESLDALLRSAASCANPEALQRVVVYGLQVVSFRAGVFQWSRHRIRVRYSYDFWSGDRLIERGTIEEEGVGSGLRFGWLLTLTPILGNINYDKGMELAVYRCLSRSVVSLAEHLAACESGLTSALS